MVSKGHEQMSFPDALDAEEKRVEGELARMESDPHLISLPFRRYSYVGHGMYARQLDTWFSHYAPSRFLIIQSEDFYRDPTETYIRVLDFLGLRHSLPATFPTYAYDIRPAVKALRCDQSTRERLLLTFEQPNARLFELLGTKFDWS
jgi:hypothetical protein